MTGGGGEGGWEEEDKMISEICVKYRNALKMRRPRPRPYDPNGDKQFVTFAVAIVHHVNATFPGFSSLSIILMTFLSECCSGISSS